MLGKIISRNQKVLCDLNWGRNGIDWQTRRLRGMSGDDSKPR